MFLDTYITNHELNILNATSAKKTLISELQKYERDTSHITTFSLVNSNIGHEGVLALVQALNNDKLKNLTHLNLSSNNIGHEGALALVQALNNDKLKSLTHLDLRNSNIGHEGIKALNELKNSGRFPNLTIHFGGNTTNKEKPSINGKSEFHGESTQLESSDDNQNNDHLPKSDKLSSEDAERAVKGQSYVFYKQRTDKVC